jgi:hypothetical protein
MRINISHRTTQEAAFFRQTLEQALVENEEILTTINRTLKLDVVDVVLLMEIRS